MLLNMKKIKIDSKSFEEKLILNLKAKRTNILDGKMLDRYLNLQKKRLNNKLILLVDDGATSGSTLESCIETLRET